MNDESLIEHLKRMDEQQLEQIKPVAAQSLVQIVVQLAARRRAQKRTRVMLGAVACVGGVLVALLWMRPEPKVFNDNAIVDADRLPASQTHEEHELSIAELSNQGAVLSTIVDSFAESDRELEAELQSWRAEHARLKRRLEELETMILREELSKNFEADDVTKDIFY